MTIEYENLTLMDDDADPELKPLKKISHLDEKGSYKEPFVICTLFTGSTSKEGIFICYNYEYD